MIFEKIEAIHSPFFCQKDFLIYPGKLTVADTFRIGCIGNLYEQDMHDTIDAIREVLNELQLKIQ